MTIKKGPSLETIQKISAEINNFSCKVGVVAGADVDLDAVAVKKVDALFVSFGVGVINVDACVQRP